MAFWGILYLHYVKSMNNEGPSGAELQRAFRNAHDRGNIESAHAARTWLREKHVVDVPDEAREAYDLDIPEVSPDEAHELLTLYVNDIELAEAARLLDDRQKGPMLMYILSGRNIREELPFAEETKQSFLFARHMDEMVRGKVAAHKLVDAAWHGRTISKEAIQDAYTQGKKALALELRKAEWLEQTLYPKMYERPINAARAEIRQFLVEQVNMGHTMVTRFPDVDAVGVRLMDELQYVADYKGERMNSSVGEYDPQKREMRIRIPDYYSREDEWKVFMVAIHEFVHGISEQSGGRVGIEHQYRDPSFMELNEAVTEIVSFAIARDHLSQGKTPLRGQNPRTSEADSGYAEYIHITKKLFDRIPKQAFIDAMLTAEGFQTLVDRFEEVFDDPMALVKFGRNLRDLYASPRERARRREQGEYGDQDSLDSSQRAHLKLVDRKVDNE